MEPTETATGTAQKTDRLGRKRSSLNTSAKGGRVERIIGAFLAEHGYHVRLPAFLSRTAFDRIATRTYCVTHAMPAPCEIGPDERALYDPGCAFVIDERWIQIKSNGWCMSEKRGDLAKVVKSHAPPAHASREFMRHNDAKGVRRPLTERVFARQILPDGTWRAIPLLPEWGDDELPGRF